MLKFRLITFILLMLFFLLGCETDRKNFTKKVEEKMFNNLVSNTILKKGEKNKTFLFSYSDKIYWSGTPKYPVMITIENNKGEILKKIRVEKDMEFKIEEYLEPGNYSIYSRLLIKDTNYKDAIGPKFSIDKSGIVNILRCKIKHVIRIKLIKPEWNEKVENKNILFVWEPVTSSKYYSIYISYSPNDSISVEKYKHSIYKLDEIPVGHSNISWEIKAYNNEGSLVASGFSLFRIQDRVE